MVKKYQCQQLTHFDCCSLLFKTKKTWQLLNTIVSNKKKHVFFLATQRQLSRIFVPPTVVLGQ